DQRDEHYPEGTRTGVLHDTVLHEPALHRSSVRPRRGRARLADRRAEVDHAVVLDRHEGVADVHDRVLELAVDAGREADGLRRLETGAAMDVDLDAVQRAGVIAARGEHGEQAI